MRDTQQSRGKGGGETDARASPFDSLVSPAKPADHQCFASVEEAVAGLSKRLGWEVDTHFVAAFFANNHAGTIDLPPKPRMDPDLVDQVAKLINPVNRSVRDVDPADAFLEQTFKAAAERRLSSYELQLLEFAVKHKDTIEFQFDYHSRDHAQETPLSGEHRVVFGGWHHRLDREYTPAEAFGTLMHELAHEREMLYGNMRRQTATGIILSEVNANIYAASGNIRVGIMETARNYVERWKELSANLPGFSTLTPIDQYRYLVILCREDQRPEDALASHADALKEAFPSIGDLIDQRLEKIHQLEEARVDFINDVISNPHEEDEAS